MDLRYGMNPHQRARIIDGGEHIRLVHGAASMINYLDALNAWQLVTEAARATGRVAATSFKHLSPAGAALDGDLDDTARKLWQRGTSRPGPLAAAYIRARDADPRSSFGDMVAVSEPVDDELADLLATVVSDGIIAPGYAPGTVAKLARKKGGRYVVFEIDPAYRPPDTEIRTIFGVGIEQDRDARPITADVLRPVDGHPLGENARTDALLGMVTARYTQSNSVVFVRDGMTVGVGAGQQSRIDCTRLAGAKARTWWLRRHPAVRGLSFADDTPRQERLNRQIALASATGTAPDDRMIEADDRAAWSARLTGVVLVSDGYLPFPDNVDVAAEHGVTVVVEPGGASRAEEIAEACRRYRMALVRTDLRLFHH